MTDGDIQAYEYSVLEVGSEGLLGMSKTSEIPEKRLNEMGSNGWELVEQINMENGATQALIFKRPIDGNEDPKRVCPECGLEVPRGAKHCGDCGFSFGTGGNNSDE